MSTRKSKIVPNLNREVTKTLNLIVLQRIDSTIEEILMTASHVTVYEFDISGTFWSRKKVEGALFVVKRNCEPRFQFVVLNRLSTENLVENLLEDTEFEIQLPYLLYKNERDVMGLWFYNPSECVDVEYLFKRILNAIAKKVPAQITESTSISESEVFEAVSTSGRIEGPLEPQFAPSAAEDNSFLNFLLKSLNIGNSSQAHHTAIPLSCQLPVHLSISSDSRDINRVTQSFLLPAYYAPAISTHMPARISVTGSTSAVRPPPNLQCTLGYEDPLLRWFPPPQPPAPQSHSPGHPTLTREKVRDALQTLLQDNYFIEMFYQALTKGNQ